MLKLYHSYEQESPRREGVAEWEERRYWQQRSRSICFCWRRGLGGDVGGRSDGTAVGEVDFQTGGGGLGSAVLYAVAAASLFPSGEFLLLPPFPPYPVTVSASRTHLCGHRSCLCTGKFMSVYGSSLQW